VTLREHLEEFGRDVTRFPVSKRVFLSIDDDPLRARAELESWFGDIYGKPGLVDSHGVFGSVSDVAAHVEELVDAGANHVILNPVGRHLEQLEELARVVDAVGAPAALSPEPTR